MIIKLNYNSSVLLKSFQWLHQVLDQLIGRLLDLLFHTSDSFSTTLDHFIGKFRLFFFLQIVTEFPELITNLLQLQNISLDFLSKCFQVFVNMEFHFFYWQRLHSQLKGHVFSILLLEILKVHCPVVLVIGPKTKIAMLLYRVEMLLIATSIELLIILQYVLGMLVVFKRYTFSAEIALNIVLLLNFSENPAEKSQEEGNVDLISIYLVKIHYFLQKKTVGSCISPNSLRVEQGILMFARPLF